MTGSALNLALKLVVRHDELENANHAVLHESFWIGLKKLAYKHVNYNLALYPEIHWGGGGVLPFLKKKAQPG